jgi:hypothetical protein
MSLSWTFILSSALGSEKKLALQEVRIDVIERDRESETAGEEGLYLRVVSHDRLGRM